MEKTEAPAQPEEENEFTKRIEAKSMDKKTSDILLRKCSDAETEWTGLSARSRV